MSDQEHDPFDCHSDHTVKPTRQPMYLLHGFLITFVLYEAIIWLLCYPKAGPAAAAFEATLFHDPESIVVLFKLYAVGLPIAFVCGVIYEWIHQLEVAQSIRWEQHRANKRAHLKGLADQFDEVYAAIRTREDIEMSWRIDLCTKVQALRRRVGL